MPPPADAHRLSPHLTCAGAAAAIDFYKQAFGAVEIMRLPAPDGTLAHASILIEGARVLLADERVVPGAPDRDPDHPSPTTLGGTPVTLHLIVGDVDAVFARAVAAGAWVVMAVAPTFWGDRYGILLDPFGHRWSISTPIAPPPASSEDPAATDRRGAPGQA
jgi:uncharacterized glyoxalase superfamily protein PhnB